MNNKIYLIIKILFFSLLNFDFSFIIYFISLRPLSPSEEQLLINLQNKTLLNLTFECIILALFLTLTFSLLSYISFRLIFKKNYYLKYVYLIIFIFYFVILNEILRSIMERRIFLNYRPQILQISQIFL